MRIKIHPLHLIGMRLRNWPGAPQQAEFLEWCIACRRPFFSPEEAHGRNHGNRVLGCYVCSVTEAEHGRKVDAKQAAKAEKRRQNNERAARKNPAWK